MKRVSGRQASAPHRSLLCSVCAELSPQECALCVLGPRNDAGWRARARQRVVVGGTAFGDVWVLQNFAGA
jgi:hypothetical protein